MAMYLQVTVLSLELASPTLPPGKHLIMNLQDQAHVATLKKNPVTIKEGIEYKCVCLLFRSVDRGLKAESYLVSVLTSRSTTRSSRYVYYEFPSFRPPHANVCFQGVRYIQVVKRSGVRGERVR